MYQVCVSARAGNDTACALCGRHYGQQRRCSVVVNSGDCQLRRLSRGGKKQSGIFCVVNVAESRFWTSFESTTSERIVRVMALSRLKRLRPCDPGLGRCSSLQVSNLQAGFAQTIE